MKRFFHWLAHITKYNEGRVITWWDEEKLMVGFQCDGCGEVSGAQTNQ